MDDDIFRAQKRKNCNSTSHVDMFEYYITQVIGNYRTVVNT